MRKDISQYIHLYLGCEVEVDAMAHGEKPYTGQLQQINTAGQCIVASLSLTRTTVMHKIKPILRPLSSMTEEEAKELLLFNEGEATKIFKIGSGGFYYGFKNDSTEYCKYVGYCNPSQFCYLLSKGFDLFDLIPSGLAQEKTIK